AVAAEISGERLFADDMLAGFDRGEDHAGMQRGRRADVDDVDLLVREQRAEIAIGRADAMLLGEVDDVVAARGDRRDLRVDAVDALIGVHVQLGRKSAADEAYSDLGHCARSRFWERILARAVLCANVQHAAERMFRRRRHAIRSRASEFYRRLHRWRMKMIE